MRRVPPLRAASLVLLLVLHAAPACPETLRFRLTPAQGHIAFKASSRLMDADGRFHRFEGEVRVDPRAPEQAHVTVSVDALSVDTGIRRRDNHLRSEDFFDAARFPLITFTGLRITAAEGKALVTGALSFHGITREVTVPVELELGGPALRARGGFTIRMSDFGITYRSFLNPIRDEVEILFDLRGVPER